MSRLAHIQDTIAFDINNLDSITIDFDVRNASSATIWVKENAGPRAVAVLEAYGSLVKEDDTAFSFEKTGKKILFSDVRVQIDTTSYCFINVKVTVMEGEPSTVDVCINSFE